MLSYIVALIAALIFFANPISEYLFPGHTLLKSSTRLRPRPQLNESLLAIDAANTTAPECPADAYTARILNREPLVVYLEGFLSSEERKQLLEIR